jgi:hypothetical protein
MTTRRELIGRVRNNLKETTADTQFTNRYIWRTIWSVAKLVLERNARDRRLYSNSSFWNTICLDMEPVSPILCDCLSLPLDCTMYRSKEKINSFLETTHGPLTRFVSSVDLSQTLIVTTPIQYEYKRHLRFKKEKYVFFHDGYLWTSDVSWPKILVSGIPADSSLAENCLTNSEGDCFSILDLNSNIPDFLEEDIIRNATQDLLTPKQIIKDETPNVNTTQPTA